jgi:hypothetical protein
MAKKQAENPSNSLVHAGETPMGTTDAPGGIETMRPLRVRSINSSLRLLGRVLFLAQRGAIDHNLARLLIYGCQVYSGIVKDGQFEDRLAKIEQSLKEKNNGK